MTGYVGLTFDDGPNPDTTEALLAALAASGAPATLFNIGQHVRDHPALTRAQLSAGMWVGNHSWTHPHLTTLPPPRIGSELRRASQALGDTIGAQPQLFRPPYGDTNPSVRAAAADLGLTEVLWDVDSRDWAGATADEIVAAATRLTDGQVILLHDGYTATIAAIPRILADLRARDLAPGMVSPATGRAVAPA
ncbi:polysaccharide deacetylase family protein [Dactylosporangium sp. CA-092794]|uniref:polysaccharide deacetylase family protein n=1 Tax=Dactylosporangium sp. CA-092794 TaxID=3239929 RepID=UPI003D8CA5AC